MILRDSIITALSKKIRKRFLHLFSHITYGAGGGGGLVMLPVMLPIVSFCAYALEIPVVSKNPVVESAIVAPTIANAVNTTKIARFVLDDMFDTIETQSYISIV